MKLFRKEVSRRALRTLVRDEFAEFMRWIKRKPEESDGWEHYLDGPVLEPPNDEKGYRGRYDDLYDDDYSLGDSENEDHHFSDDEDARRLYGW